MKNHTKIILTFSFLLLLSGCGQHQKTSHSKPATTRTHQQKKKTKTLEFTKGVPKDFQAVYHQYTPQANTVSDEMSEVKFTKTKLSMKDLVENVERESLDDIYYYQLTDNSYILYDDISFKKVKILANKDIAVFRSRSKYQDAVDNTDKEIYHPGPVPKDLRLLPKNLDNKFYVSDNNPARYLSFNCPPENSYLAIVQMDGEEKYPIIYKDIMVKNGKYVLNQYNLNQSKEILGQLVLLRLSKTKLQDANTGETYSLFQNKNSTPKETAIDKLGITIKPKIYHVPEKHQTKEQKTYDFADDQDDDYYDTYDDFGLNEGDD
ncbi:hypothetical protein [Companilactobacillus halodurans]|uniref:Lipoprotein n=1 Tax=Companilactobacillus halodurans TaxID=2584183 RepID=A0A5P0ZLZ1_9LACO|nr:hypothetical protein [Companilactobacillus halodurans]MQS75227.1 hypothetical protein [Companilactobacillus halodurans]MQS97957.1 hypothetical protein [Companilactobacillus halodurans]